MAKCVVCAPGMHRADRRLFTGLRPLLQAKGEAVAELIRRAPEGGPLVSNVVLYLRAGESLYFLKG